MKDRKMFERPIIEYAIREILKKKIGTSSCHTSAFHLKKLDEKAWNKYFKFTFVRNPYTHAISAWLFDEKRWSIINPNTKINKQKLSKKKFTHYLKNFKKQMLKKDNRKHDMLPYKKFIQLMEK